MKSLPSMVLKRANRHQCDGLAIQPPGDDRNIAFCSVSISSARGRIGEYLNLALICETMRHHWQNKDLLDTAQVRRDDMSSPQFYTKRASCSPEKVMFQWPYVDFGCVIQTKSKLGNVQYSYRGKLMFYYTSKNELGIIPPGPWSPPVFLSPNTINYLMISTIEVFLSISEAGELLLSILASVVREELINWRNESRRKGWILECSPPPPDPHRQQRRASI